MVIDVGLFVEPVPPPGEDQRMRRYRLMELIRTLSVGLLLQGVSSAEVLTVSTPFLGPGGEYVTTAEKYHTFRIPGMVAAADGSIVVFAEGRRGDGDDPRIDENAPIDIVMRRSTDHGKSWGPLQVIDTGFREGGKLVDFGDPTPVLDEETGTIFLLHGQFPDIASRDVEFSETANGGRGNHLVWVRSSRDHGVTWSERRQVVFPNRPGETSDGLYWRHAEPGPGTGIQLKWQKDDRLNGRLVVPAKRAGSKTPDGPTTTEPFVYYSDDHGETWQLGNVTGGPDANESEVVELTDGRLLLDARQSEGNYRRRHISTDGGITWSANRPDDIPLTRVDGSLARYSARRAGHERDRILFSAPQGDGGLNRNNLALWTSYDEGQSFVNPKLIHRGFAAYSVLQRLSDGTIGVLVETTGTADAAYGAITFYRIDLNELE